MDEDSLLAETPQAEDAAEPGPVSHTETVAGEEGAEGMPQLDPSSFDNQIFWLVLALVAIYLIVTRVAVPRIGTILASRAGTISGDLAAAETLRAQAREAEAAYDRALAEARAEAGRIAAATRAEIQAGLDAELAKADAQIAAKAAEGARAIEEIAREADASVLQVARDAAREVVAAMGGTVDDAAVDAAVAAQTTGRTGGAA